MTKHIHIYVGKTRDGRPVTNREKTELLNAVRKAKDLAASLANSTGDREALVVYKSLDSVPHLISGIKTADTHEGSLFHVGQIASAIRLVEARKDMTAAEKQEYIAHLKKSSLSDVSKRLQWLKSGKSVANDAPAALISHLKKLIEQDKKLLKAGEDRLRLEQSYVSDMKKTIAENEKQLANAEKQLAVGR